MMRTIWKTKPAMTALLAVCALIAATSAAMADGRWRHRDWDRGDWRRHHPYVYIGPAYPYYYPPPVVYAPPPAPPLFSFQFRFD
jgi:hypothetical protein